MVSIILLIIMFNMSVSYSIAKCLGAKTVCDRALECARKYKVISLTVDDKDALQAVEMFLGRWK